MARETKAEREARLAAEREARLVEERNGYPARLMAVLERVNNQWDMELFVRDNLFVVRSRNDNYGNECLLSYNWNPTTQETIQELEWKLNSLEEAQAEAKRRSEVKREAQRKVQEILSDEERELLGLK